MAFLRNVSSVGGLTIVSRVTGYLRDLMLANFVGVSGLSDAIALAIKLPAFFRRLFADGAFHVSFLPVFTGLLERSKNKDEPFIFASNAFSWLFFTVLFLILLVEWQMHGFISLLFSGLRDKPETLALVVRLGRITFPYILCISLVSFFGSLLNAFGRFTLLASSHALFNIFIIGWFCFFGPRTKEYGDVFAWSMIFAGIAQLLFVCIPCWRRGWRIRLCIPTVSPTMKQFFKKLGPGMLGVGVVQINILVGFYLGSHLASGGISYIYYADRLNQLPLSIIGISLSSVLLPLLARQIHSKNFALANKTQNHAVRFAASLTLPLVTLIACLAVPIACVLFGHGRLTPKDVSEVAKTMVAFSCGIPAYIAVKIMNARFFAEGNMRTPLYGSCVGVSTDVVFSLLLMPYWHHIGLGAAVALSGWVHAGFLFVWLWQDKAWILRKSTTRFLGRMSVGTAVMGLFLCLVQRATPSFFMLTLFQQIGLLLSLTGAGMAVFLAVCWRLHIISIRQARLLWRSMKTA